MDRRGRPGATIATRNGGKTWSAGKAGPLFTVRGSATAPLWSPDGSRIAITNVRGDHSYVALYTLGAPNVTFAAPGFSNDQNPVWSPDGSKIAFVRLPGVVSTLSFYDDASLYPPWSIVVADTATGEGGTAPSTVAEASGDAITVPSTVSVIGVSAPE